MKTAVCETPKPEVPPEIIGRWQITVELMADITGVASGVITRLHPTLLEVLLASESAENPYKRGGTALLHSGLCCETVILKRDLLHVPNALKDPDWAENPNVALGLISYLGVPLLWPDGEIFGTLCILDKEEMRYSDTWQRLLWTFKGSVDADLKLLVELAERRRAEEALRLAKEAAETANRAKSVFLANMSHELRTPLNAILGFSQLMQRDANLSGVQRENLETIGRSGQHLLGLINHVLDMSKIEAGLMVLSESVFDLHGVVAGVLDLFRPRAAHKGLSLRLDLPAELPRYVRSDEGKLRQVLINLIGNAIKFTDRGEVSVRLRCEEPQKDGGASRLSFSIADTGVGIRPEEVDRLFVPFMQASSGQIVDEGTGLGLAISRNFVQLLGGDIQVTSGPGQGSVFCFDVPVALAGASEGAPTPAPRRVVELLPGEPRYRILVVEDNPINRRLLCQLLSAVGLDVRAAGSAMEGIDTWKEWRPHLIWMDIRMPGMDGREATRRIKAAEEGPATIVIALTASAFEEERAEILSAGCDDFVRKPFQEEEIFEIMTRHLGVRFRYEEAATKEDPVALSLDALPAALRAELREAAVQLDPELCLGVCDLMEPQHPAEAKALRRMVGDLRFEGILALAGPTAS